MLYTDFTEKLIGLQDINVTNVEENGEETVIFIELKRKMHSCICCGTATDTVHDYRKQIIKDITAFGKKTTLVLRKRRYRCPNCGKRFFEKRNAYGYRNFKRFRNRVLHMFYYKSLALNNQAAA